MARLIQWRFSTLQQLQQLFYFVFHRYNLKKKRKRWFQQHRKTPDSQSSSLPLPRSSRTLASASARKNAGSRGGIALSRPLLANPPLLLAPKLHPVPKSSPASCLVPTQLRDQGEDSEEEVKGNSWGYSPVAEETSGHTLGRVGGRPVRRRPMNAVLEGTGCGTRDAHGLELGHDDELDDDKLRRRECGSGRRVSGEHHKAMTSFQSGGQQSGSGAATRRRTSAAAVARRRQREAPPPGAFPTAGVPRSQPCAGMDAVARRCGRHRELVVAAQRLHASWRCSDGLRARARSDWILIPDAVGVGLR